MSFACDNLKIFLLAQIFLDFGNVCQMTSLIYFFAANYSMLVYQFLLKNPISLDIYGAAGLERSTFILQIDNSSIRE